MYTGIEEQKSEYFKIGAALFGIDLNKETVKKKETNRMIFKDPSEYADMSDEEKKALSKEMMGHYKMLVSNQVKGIKTDA
jgi:hypothetical protein